MWVSWLSDSFWYATESTRSTCCIFLGDVLLNPQCSGDGNTNQTRGPKRAVALLHTVHTVHSNHRQLSVVAVDLKDGESQAELAFDFAHEYCIYFSQEMGERTTELTHRREESSQGLIKPGVNPQTGDGTQLHVSDLAVGALQKGNSAEQVEAV